MTNKSSNLSNHNLIKRYNFYSMRVLSAMEESTLKEDESQSEIENKKIKLDEEIEDLQKDGDLSNLKGAHLNLTHVDRYFYAPKANEKKMTTTDFLLKSNNPKTFCERTLNEMFEWNLNVKKVNEFYLR